MKKSLIALAVLAASGAAMAQSSVTLYGVLDIGASKLKGGKWGLNNGDEGYGGSPNGFQATSRIGFKGVEDLGGGLSARFGLETGGLDLSTGSSTLSFGREAYVGLGGASWGLVQLGRTTSIGADVMGTFDLNGTAYSSAYDRGGISGVTWYGSSRRSSQFKYTSPNFGGVVARASFIAKGDQANAQGTNVTSAAKNQYSLGLSYANGPLAIGAVAETKAANGYRTAYAVGASYNLDVVKVAATYNRRESEGVKNYNGFVANGGNFGSTGTGLAGGKGWTLAVSAPLGAANVGVAYARNTGADIKALEVFANYALSKRTTLYVDYGKGYDQNVSAVAAPANPYAVGLGVVHTF
ncbi:porin [Pseudorhodoferax sp.]|uniref:porin n=1 Tax=Pseudorhodoferax sp. TaxID=1993553 RepID=UPI0039E3BCCF